jgi:hypothetical protein
MEDPHGAVTRKTSPREVACCLRKVFLRSQAARSAVRAGCHGQSKFPHYSSRGPSLLVARLIADGTQTDACAWPQSVLTNNPQALEHL